MGRFSKRLSKVANQLSPDKGFERLSVAPLAVFSVDTKAMAHKCDLSVIPHSFSYFQIHS